MQSYKVSVKHHTGKWESHNVVACDQQSVELYGANFPSHVVHGVGAYNHPDKTVQVDAEGQGF